MATFGPGNAPLNLPKGKKQKRVSPRGKNSQGGLPGTGFGGGGAPNVGKYFLPPSAAGGKPPGLNYGGDVPPGGFPGVSPPNPGVGPGYQGPPKGGGQRPGVTDQWIHNQLSGIDPNRQFTDGQYANQWSSNPQLKAAMQSLASQGLGRKGLRYLLENQGLQSGLAGGVDAKSTMAMMRSLTPEQIRYAMQNNIGRGKVSEANWGDAQTQMFGQFPELWEQYVSGIPNMDPARLEQMRRAYYASQGGSPGQAPAPVSPPVSPGPPAGQHIDPFGSTMPPGGGVPYQQVPPQEIAPWQGPGYGGYGRYRRRNPGQRRGLMDLVGGY